MTRKASAGAATGVRALRREASLGGTWEIRLANASDATWRPAEVPGCWEEAGLPKNESGPVTFRRHFDVPVEAAGSRLWLRFGAVSYACRVAVNGRVLATHVGAWDAFEFEITGAAEPGAAAELVVEVEKPASPIAGPDSDTVSGRFPLRETLAGFLPYVWGHLFGGIWQDVLLVSTGRIVIEEAHIRGDAEGRLEVEADLSEPAEIDLVIIDPDGREVVIVRTPPERHVRLDLELPEPVRPWSPQDPALYTALFRVAHGDERRLRFGIRSVDVEGTTILLNGEPLYPRLVLSWGWYADRLYPNPERERLREDLLELRALGYNGVKLCLWFPPEHYFDLADELGMVLWVELPMWLPRPSAGFRAQVGIEYDRLVRQAREHPSVIVYTLGCELDLATSDLLGPLYEQVKHLAGDALVRDNSGSGEAYGGRLDEFADFYDNHFYSELPYLRGLLDHFSPRWRPVQPWLFGEFCDSDAFRDPRLLLDGQGRQAWWTSRDPAVNPQGARWAMDLPGLEEELRLNGELARSEELRTVSESQALLHRKYTLELVRSYGEVSGYVVTGERDTPISTAGMLDDAGRQRFELRAFRAFNDDLVLVVGWDRQRAWVAGGDRAATADTWSHRSGAQVRAHLIASHYGRARGRATVRWSVASLDEGSRPGPPFAGDEIVTLGEVRPGEVRELGIARFTAPDVAAPCCVVLHASVAIAGEMAENEWPLWIYPADPWPDIEGVGLIDPAGRLADLERLLPGRLGAADSADVTVATAWTAQAAALAEGGGRIILLELGTDGPLPAVEMPFWREAIRVAELHPAWGDFPVGPFPGLQFLAMSTDRALDGHGQPGARSIFRRIDARTGRARDYALELPWGAGRLLVSTLRLDGRAGDQPLGITRSPAALYLLECWLRWLRTDGQ